MVSSTRGYFHNDEDLFLLNGEFAFMVIAKHCTIYVSDMNSNRKCEDLISHTMTLWKDVLHLISFFCASCNPRHNHATELTKLDEQIRAIEKNSTMLKMMKIPNGKRTIQTMVLALHSLMMNKQYVQSISN